ncbi:hypothetical protein OUZ56_024910 [Daphnia magna]|uniref:Uncharacterized protein n=1 Tax=Daphnia magna TaxID=35525 RepID=A0ABQ9ZIC8_9CRUS|nr:hypothetical protein OUZ56_024910 [Daphnia magna]
MHESKSGRVTGASCVDLYTVGASRFTTSPESKSERWRRRIKKRRKKQYAKVVGFVLGHQPARIDPAANRPSLASAPRRRSAIEMIPENVAPMTCVATNAGDADGRPAIIGEGPQHLQKNKQQREFQFVFGCEFHGSPLLTLSLVIRLSHITSTMSPAIPFPYSL